MMTFGDVFARLDPEQFQRCFMEWVQAVAQVTQGEVVAIRQDGTALPRPYPGKKAFTWSVWASSHGLALGQAKVDEKFPMKSPPSPSCYSCSSSPVASSPDAMGCQREIAREIIEAQALSAGGEGESRPAVR